MGYQGLGDEGVITSDATPIASPPATQPTPVIITGGNATRDPLWEFNKEEAIRLCRVYEEEMGLMYPVVDIEQVIRHATNLYNFLSAATRTGLAPTPPPYKGINDAQSCVLKVILAITSTTEGHGQSEIGNHLFESVKVIADRILHSNSIEVKDLPFLALVVSLS